MHGKRDRANKEKDTGGNLRKHGGFRLPHTSNAFALVRFGFPLLGLARSFTLCAFVLLLFDTAFTGVTLRLGIIYASLVRVELPPAFHAFYNVFSHGMSNSLRFISVLLTFNTIIAGACAKVKKNADH